MDATLETLYAYVGEIGFQNTLLRKENEKLQTQVKLLTPKPPVAGSAVQTGEQKDSNAG